MIKKDFVEIFSQKTGETKKRSKELVETFLDLVGDVLQEDDNLHFVGWGGFEVKETPSRKVVHPTSKEEIIIPAKKVVKFKLGKNMSKNISDSITDKGQKKFSINGVIKSVTSIFSKK